MLKRRGWIGRLLGVCFIADPLLEAEVFSATKIAKPENNKCPVCGTMATEQLQSPGILENCKSSGEGLLTCDQTYQPREMVVRCKYCNNAFWQDAVRPK